MQRAEKKQFVDDFRERVSRSPAIYLTDFTGLDVKSMTELRQSLRKAGADYVVVKNRLALLALAETDLPDLSSALTGPTGVILGFEGAVEPARSVTEFQKDHDDRPVFKLGVLEGALLEPAQIDRLATLPPREELLAELAGAMEAPMAALAGALESVLREVGGLFEALRNERQQDE